MTPSGRKKNIVLLSGGLDSTVAFKKALDDDGVMISLTFDYGQRAARREIEAAAAISRRYDVAHQVIDLPWLKAITSSALVNRGRGLPQLSEDELDNAGSATASAAAVWVPNRNGIFINIAAAFCEVSGADRIVTGFNAEEAATFPDNSLAFVTAVNASLSYSTRTGVRLVAPTAPLMKREIIRLALEINAPLDLVWSCYEGGPKMCGSCESCLRLKRGLESEKSILAAELFGPHG